MRTTSNVGFYSLSNVIGSTRWLIELPGLMPRGYLIHCRHMPGLSSRWWLVGLVEQEGRFHLRTLPVGSSAEVSLEPEDLTALLANVSPEVDLLIDTEDQAVAVGRMERGASNVMHGLLEPTIRVLPLWRKIAASDDPHNLYG